MTENTVSPYQLFYVEVIMRDSSYPHIYEVMPLFKKLTEDEFFEMVDSVFSSGDSEQVQQFLYFLLLFREMEHIQKYINNQEKFSRENLERLVVFIYGYCLQHDHTTERIIDEILLFINNERLIDLALHSTFISKDKLFLFLILSKFNTEQLTRYFNTIDNAETFIINFTSLPDDVLKSLVSRNYHLFQYIMMMAMEMDISDMHVKSFFDRYKDDIKHYSKLNDKVREYKKKFSRENNENVSNEEMGRLALLANMVKEFYNIDSAIEYFAGENIFKNEFEKKLLKALLTDPILKSAFNDYDKIYKLANFDSDSLK